MHQRDVVRAAWADAGLYRTKDKKLLQFLKHFDETPMDCWPQVVDTVRAVYPEYIEQLVVPIWQTGDALLRVNLIRAADLTRKNERDLVAKVVPKLDPAADRNELSAVIHHGTKDVLGLVLKRKNLPENLRVLAAHRQAVP